jgi:UDPglucose 6-dehydrogenase
MTHIKNKKYKITVVGSGYVGLSLAVLLAQYHKVTVYDIDPVRVNKINIGKSTISDDGIESLLAKNTLNLEATQDTEYAYKHADFIVVATPTNYDTEENRFDTSSVDLVVKDVLALNSKCLIIIKSTIPVGHTESLRNKFQTQKIIFSPEFLREGFALHDNLFPSRIIIGSHSKQSKDFASLLSDAAEALNVPTLFVGSSEAEAIKLFANTYLAMRVSFFNELDSYAFSNDLNTSDIIDGLSLDKRIGDGYNNPSFGYGGYCLPKDTKQLLANFNQVPQSLIKAIVSSNSIRKDFIAEKIMINQPKVVGFFRLIMKEGSDNFRSSAIEGVLERLRSKGARIIIYEPILKQDTFNGFEVVTDKKAFIKDCCIIVANRMSSELDHVNEKVFTRDQFNSDI